VGKEEVQKKKKLYLDSLEVERKWSIDVAAIGEEVVIA